MSDLNEVLTGLEGDAAQLDQLQGEFQAVNGPTGDLDAAIGLTNVAREAVASAVALEAGPDATGSQETQETTAKSERKLQEAEKFRDTAGENIDRAKEHAGSAAEVSDSCQTVATTAHSRIANRLHTSHQHVASHAIGACARLVTEAALTSAPIREAINTMPDKSANVTAFNAPINTLWEAGTNASQCAAMASMVSAALREYVSTFRGGGSYAPNDPDYKPPVEPPPLFVDVQLPPYPDDPPAPRSEARLETPGTDEDATLHGKNLTMRPISARNDPELARKTAELMSNEVYSGEMSPEEYITIINDEELSEYTATYAFTDGSQQLIGAANVSTANSEFVVMDIAVTADSRSQGHGKAMLRNIAEQARRQGFTTIRLSTEPETRQEQFFLREGFVKGEEEGTLHAEVSRLLR